jgi:hypothetical protein
VNEEQTSSYPDTERLIALADYYDQQGLHNKADAIYEYLKGFWNSLPTEVKLRISDKSPHDVAQGMNEYEHSQGSIYLRGHPAWYLSGKNNQNVPGGYVGLSTKYV